MRLSIIILLVLLLAACQPADTGRVGESEDVTPPSPPAETRNMTFEDTVSFEGNGVNMSIRRPTGWESFKTEYGVVIAEKFGSVATGGVLEGLMAYVFATPLEDITTRAQFSPAGNRAKAILDEIVGDPEYVGKTIVSQPVAFTWNDHEAAYYMLRDPELDLMTLVVGVTVEGSDMLVTGTISAPATQELRIRDALPSLLDELNVNNVQFSGAAFSELPDPLNFPEE